MPNDDVDVLDAALARLAPSGPDLVNGMTNHAPMVVEALCTMNRADWVDAWIDDNLASFTPWPEARAPIVEREWREAAGQPGRASDWRAFFGAQLESADWRGVLDGWSARLAPGAAAAAGHGLIRVGHAARSLARRDSRPRRAELAAALALWASSYSELPTGARSPVDRHSARAALAEVTLLPAARRRNAGSITAALRQLQDHAPFPEVVDLLNPMDDVGAAVPTLVELFACVFLTNATTALEGVVFTHGITIHAAVGNIAPSVSPTTARRLQRYAWQTSAALYAAYGTRAPLGHLPRTHDTGEDIIALAVASGDDHLIKLTEACLTWAPHSGAAQGAGAALIALISAD